MPQLEIAKDKTKEFPYKIGTYFTTGKNLYNIIDCLENEVDPTFLIEDCKTEKKKWIEKSSLVRMRKEVITPK